VTILWGLELGSDAIRPTAYRQTDGQTDRWHNNWTEICHVSQLNARITDHTINCQAV